MLERNSGDSPSLGTNDTREDRLEKAKKQLEDEGFDHEALTTGSVDRFRKWVFGGRSGEVLLRGVLGKGPASRATLLELADTLFPEAAEAVDKDKIQEQLADAGVHGRGDLLRRAPTGEINPPFYESMAEDIAPYVTGEWLSISEACKMAGVDDIAMDERRSDLFETALNKLGCEVNRQGKNGWEIRKN